MDADKENKQTSKKLVTEPLYTKTKSLPPHPTIKDRPSRSIHTESLSDDNQTSEKHSKAPKSKSMTHLNQFDNNGKNIHKSSNVSTISGYSQNDASMEHLIRIHGSGSDSPMDEMLEFQDQDVKIQNIDEYPDELKDIDTPIPTDRKSTVPFPQLPTHATKPTIVLSLMASRLGILLFFSASFIAVQPYNNSIAQYILHPHDSVKFIVAFVLVASILASCFCAKKYYQDDYYKHSVIPSQHPPGREKSKRWSMVVALGITILAESFFIYSITQWLTPIFFGLSCLAWMAQYYLSDKRSLAKLCFSILCLIGVGGSVALLLDAFNEVPAFIGHHTWSCQVLPITLIISTVAAMMITSESLIAECCRKKNHQNHHRLPSFLNDTSLTHKGKKIYIEYADETNNTMFKK